MLIWQGWGVLTVVLTLAGIVLADAIAGADNSAPWAQALGFFLAAALVGPLGYYLNKRPGRVLVDPETGEKVELRIRHTLFWIPMQYWAIVLIAGGLLLLLS
ncbi:hypothetical protein E6C76_10980 [Pseudothauera nasutitermitis]|uniref:Uncharacterized protein n=1 Tax=Pseudothauera nasutitermitis TaxID=2565930 RepID=A0A4S4AXE3_9RHOO|nr:hypothetical protein [Pseudothauera nasutitermitis]THF64580.1 hypothetical protein E6C76_10980 [Pseudothauera nasutitermitis]